MTLVVAEKMQAFVLEWRDDGSLWAVRDDSERAVSVRRCFPWTEPARHLSLRDADEEEFAFVRDPADLERHLQRRAGARVEVTRVLEIDEEVEIRHWRVETQQGPRAFQTRLDDWPRTLPHGGLLIRDLAGDLYHLGRPGALDRHSRELRWAFVDGRSVDGGKVGRKTFQLSNFPTFYRWHFEQYVVCRKSILCVLISFLPHRTHFSPPRPYTRSSNWNRPRSPVPVR